MALDFKKLDSQYAISSKTLIDPPDGEKNDRVVISIQGASAKDLYDSMQAPAKSDKCSNKIQTKSAGGLECSKSSNGIHQCTVGLMLRTGASVKARVC